VNNASVELRHRLERDDRLAGDQYVPAIRADLLRRLGRHDEAEAGCAR
jgi:RNA polymerase sigma-70 factor (ECF subfamily)